MRLMRTHSGWGALSSLFVASVGVADLRSLVGLNVAVSPPANDNDNARAHNSRLSQRRVYRVERGVPADSLRATGYGEYHPVASNDSEAGRRENRRVELHIEGDRAPRGSGNF